MRLLEIRDQGQAALADPFNVAALADYAELNGTEYALTKWLSPSIDVTAGL